MSPSELSRREVMAMTVAGAGLPMTLRGASAASTERLRITQIELFQVVVPFQPDVVNSPDLAVKDVHKYGSDALEYVDRRPKIIVKVHTDSGLIGIGETPREVPMADAQANAEFLRGRNVLDLDLARLRLPQRRSAVGFEIACYDVVGRAMGWPVYQLLGGLAQESVATSYWCGRKNPQDVRRVAERAVKGGFKVLKMKCHDHDDPIVATVRAVADIAPGLRVNVDFNETYADAASFLPLARELDAIGNMHTFEDPIPKEDLTGFAELSRTLKTPVTLTCDTPQEIFTATKIDACRYINTNQGSGKTASMAQFTVNSAVAGAAGRPVWHGSGCELGILDAAMVHSCAAAGNCTLPSDILSHLRVHDLLVSHLTPRDGYIPVPRSPGLGVQLDEDAVQRYRAREVS